MDTTVPTLDAFVDTLIQEKFANQSLDERMRADIKKELTERLNQYVTLRTIEAVSQANPEAISKLQEIIKTDPKPETVRDFIQSHISQPDLLIGQIFADFHRLYVGSEEQKKTN